MATKQTIIELVSKSGFAFFNKSILAIILLNLAFVTTSANTIIPFWKEDFSAGQLPANWNSTDSSQDEILWQYCSGNDICPLEDLNSLGLFSDERFKSASKDNGYAYLYQDGFGSSSAQHSSSLQTNVINCTNKQQVFISFSTLIVAQSTDPDTGAILQVKNGNSDWIDFTIFPFLSTDLVEYAPFFYQQGNLRIQSYNGQNITLDISSVAAGEEEVEIRWQWNYRGNEDYCWLIDDIELLDENPLDENAIWGTQPGEGDFDGGLHDWQTPAFTNCDWAWSSNGLVDYPDASDEADAFGCSQTLYNGVALINATPCQAVNQVVCASLVSPIIDLTNSSSGKRIGVRFNQSGAIGNNKNNGLPVTSLMVSIDGGLTHIDTVFLNLTEPFKKPFCKNTFIPLPVEAIGAQELVIKFVFSGDSFHWMIDDVRIVELFENDLRISEDYYAVAQNYSTPSQLIQPIPFSAEVENVGDQLQESVVLEAWVINDFSKEEVFKDSLQVGDLEPGEKSPSDIFSNKFTPMPDQSYTGYYLVKSESIEERVSDNLVSFRFNTIGSTYSKTKEFYSINGGFAPNSNITKLGYEIGNCYYIPPGSNVAATSVEFALGNAKILYEIANNNSVELEVNLYRWSSGSNWGDANGDLRANPNEFARLAESKYVIESGLEFFHKITVPLPDSIPLENDTYYFVTVNYNQVVEFITVNNDTLLVPLFISGSEEINYAAMFDQSEIFGLPSYTSMLKEGNETSFRANAWGLLRTPFINLNIDTYVAIEDVEKDLSNLSVYPNPTSGELNIEIRSNKIRGEIDIEIYDICGHLVQNRQSVKGNVSQLPIDVSDLAEGMYNLRVVSDQQILTEKFVIANGY